MLRHLTISWAQFSNSRCANSGFAAARTRLDAALSPTAGAGAAQRAAADIGRSVAIGHTTAVVLFLNSVSFLDDQS